MSDLVERTKDAMSSLRLFGAPSLEGPTGYVTGHAVQPRQLAVLAVLLRDAVDALTEADRRRRSATPVTGVRVWSTSTNGGSGSLPVGTPSRWTPG